MRTRIPLGPLVRFNPLALRSEPSFSYRRMADRDREVLAVGELSAAEAPTFCGDGKVRDWTFGHLCYDLRNVLHDAASRHAAQGGFPLSRWVVPRWVVEWYKGEAVIHAMTGDEDAAIEFGDRLKNSPIETGQVADLAWAGQTSRASYLRNARRLMAHIQRGDIYEVNYCILREAIEKRFDPFPAFARLLRSTDAPFAAFHRFGDRFALCASPERFLAFDGSRVLAQPMKGTRPRSSVAGEDERLRNELMFDAKERSENIMAVDVMRNDLASVADSHSVEVEELCAVRSFPRVHQMVSTVSSRIRPGHTPFEVARAAFPMASMTGAPKLRAMELIDEVEDQARGLYSGTLGFFAPDGTGDLNVVIRTILFDKSSGRASLTTGSALTAVCDPEREWEECEWKARSIMNALSDA